MEHFSGWHTKRKNAYVKHHHQCGTDAAVGNCREQIGGLHMNSYRENALPTSVNKLSGLSELKYNGEESRGNKLSQLVLETNTLQAFLEIVKMIFELHGAVWFPGRPQSYGTLGSQRS